MDYLIGVTATDPYTLDTVVRKIDAVYPDGVESLMIRLPPNYEDAEQPAESYGEIFVRLAEIYKEKGTKIIYGLPDTPSRSYKKVRKNMVRVIQEENPQVVVVKGLDADFIARQVTAYYVLVISESARKEFKYANKVFRRTLLARFFEIPTIDLSRPDMHIAPTENPNPY